MIVVFRLSTRVIVLCSLVRYPYNKKLLLSSSLLLMFDPSRLHSSQLWKPTGLTHAPPSISANSNVMCVYRNAMVEEQRDFRGYPPRSLPPPWQMQICRQRHGLEAQRRRNMDAAEHGDCFCTVVARRKGLRSQDCHSHYESSSWTVLSRMCVPPSSSP